MSTELGGTGQPFVLDDVRRPLRANRDGEKPLSDVVRLFETGRPCPLERTFASVRTVLPPLTGATLAKCGARARDHDNEERPEVHVDAE